jgi:hypothetical protein
MVFLQYEKRPGRISPERQWVDGKFTEVGPRALVSGRSEPPQ